MTSSASSTSTASSSSSAPQVVLMGTNNSTHPTQLIAINSTQIPIKLSKGGNYAAWRSQFENLLFGYGLMEFLDGTKTCPPAFSPVASPTSDNPASQEPVPNPDHHLWLRQDRLLLHAIQVSCTGAAQSIVTRSSTSAQAWEKLESSYANRSNTRKLGLLDSLTNVSIIDKSVSEYMQSIKSILDNLELIGHIVDDGAAVIHTLNGLGPNYLPLASAIRARDSPITFEELYDKLLDYESFLKREDTKKDEPQITAQFNQRTLNRQGRGYHGRSPFMGHNNQFAPHQQFNHNQQFGHHSNNNQTFGSSTGGGRGISNPSHSYRPNNSFQQWRSPFNSSTSRPICQLCDKVGHTARVCRSRPSPASPSWPQANHMNSGQSTNHNNWILDTGASHHMTSDLQNLSLHSEYGGTEDIMVGDGSEHGGVLGPRPE